MQAIQGGPQKVSRMIITGIAITLSTANQLSKLVTHATLGEVTVTISPSTSCKFHIAYVPKIMKDLGFLDFSVLANKTRHKIPYRGRTSHTPFSLAHSFL